MTTLAAAVVTAAAGMSGSAAEGSAYPARFPYREFPAFPGAATTPGSIGIRLVDIPVDLADNPRAHEYVIDNLAPGVTVHRRIEVDNTTDSDAHVTLYPDSASIANGAFVGGPGAAVSDLTTWTSMSQPDVDIPAHSTALDTVTIAVPKDAAPGERYGVVWAQVSGGKGAGVALVNRVGVRVYLWVGGDNPPASDFTVDTMTAMRGADGHAVVQALVHNTGGRAIDMSGTLKLSEVNGSLTAGPYLVQFGTTLAPGQSQPVRATITDQITDGPWDATFDLHSGILDKTYQARITFPHDVGAASPVTAHQQTAQRHMLLLIYALVAAVVLLSALLVFGAFRRGRSRRRAAAELESETDQVSR